MPIFSQRSQTLLDTCHKDIQTICNEVIKYYDFSVISGIRSQDDQQRLFNEGKSSFNGTDQRSKYQGQEDEEGNIVSYAIDIMPSEEGKNVNNEQKEIQFYMLMGMIKLCATYMYQTGQIQHKVRLRCDMEGEEKLRDQDLNDLPPIELIR